MKVTLPAALAERVQLAAIVKGVRQSALVAELLDRHLPKLAIRSRGRGVLRTLPDSCVQINHSGCVSVDTVCQLAYSG